MVTPRRLNSEATEAKYGEGEIESSHTVGGGGDEALMILTQQSSNGVEKNEGEGGDEELVDYEDDSTALEQAQMVNLEKKVEERATKLLEDMVVTFPGTKEDGG
jgi:hypothetical protein